MQRCTHTNWHFANEDTQLLRQTIGIENVPIEWKSLTARHDWKFVGSFFSVTNLETSNLLQASSLWYGTAYQEYFHQWMDFVKLENFLLYKGRECQAKRMIALEKSSHKRTIHRHRVAICKRKRKEKMSHYWVCLPITVLCIRFVLYLSFRFPIFYRLTAKDVYYIVFVYTVSVSFSFFFSSFISYSLSLSHGVYWTSLKSLRGYWFDLTKKKTEDKY